MPPKKKTRVKDPNITKRQIVTKLELPTAEPLIQLNIVAEKVFELPGSINKQYAKDANKWHATDEIYDVARNSYQSIIDPFTELPKVYKLGSTRDKLYSFRLEEINGPADKPKAKRAAKAGTNSRYYDRLNKGKQVEEYLEDLPESK